MMLKGRGEASQVSQELLCLECYPAQFGWAGWKERDEAYNTDGTEFKTHIRKIAFQHAKCVP